MDHTYREALDDYERITSEPFIDDMYPTPESVPAELLPAVRHIKLSQAHSQQRDIYFKMKALKGKQEFVSLPDSEKHLLSDFEQYKEQIDLWKIV